MGVELVKMVSVHHGALPGNAFKVLVRMSLTALDTPSKDGKPAATYFGGWETLALALGHDVPPDSNDPATRRRRKKLNDYVDSAVRVLVDRKLLEPLGRARTGTRQSYRLTLSTAPQEVGSTSPPRSGEQCSPESGEHEPPKKWGQCPPESGEPRKDSGGTQDLTQDSNPIRPLLPTGGARQRRPDIDWDAAKARADHLDSLTCSTCSLPRAECMARERTNGHVFTPRQVRILGDQAEQLAVER